VQSPCPEPSCAYHLRVGRECRAFRWLKRESIVWEVMSNPNSEPASSDVHIWSPAPVSVNRAYHKILELVKRSRISPPSWGSVGCHRSVEKMEGKLGGKSRRVWLITMQTNSRGRDLRVFHQQKVQCLIEWSPQGVDDPVEMPIQVVADVAVLLLVTRLRISDGLCLRSLRPSSMSSRKTVFTPARTASQKRWVYSSYRSPTLPWPAGGVPPYQRVCGVSIHS
jgi:hypothetical protein